jgi:uncharacterized heparinase superfamily protein
LLWLGLSLEGELPRKCFATGIHLLKFEVAEQILADGGHFERSPRYHVIVLKDCIEIGIGLRRDGREVPVWLDGAIERMLCYLHAIVHPDGQIPLLKDSALDGIPCPSELLATGAIYLNQPRFKVSDSLGQLPLVLFADEGLHEFQKWPVNRDPSIASAFPQSGHFVMRDVARGDFLIIDGGKTCPDYLPAHAHADLLGFELSVGGQRVFVDSGVYEYGSGAWRDFFRSTRAHNTVEVKHQNQSEVWSSFRVARRAYPKNIKWNQSSKRSFFQAEQNGYERLREQVRHRRSVWCFPRQAWIVLDEIWGNGNIEARNFFHFHPQIAASVYGDTCKLDGAPEEIWITTFGARELSIVAAAEVPEKQGWYSEEFGIVTKNQVLQLEASAVDRIVFVIMISREAPGEIIPDGSSFVMKWGGHTFDLAEASTR